MKNPSANSSLADIILVVAKHFKLILILTIIGVLLTIIYVKREFEPEYTSSALIFIPSNNAPASGLSSLATQFGVNLSAGISHDISSSALYPEIVKSNRFAQRLLEREFYSDKYDKKLPLIAIFTYGIDTPKVGLDTLKMRAAGGVQHLVRFAEEHPFLRLNVTTDKPQFSKDLAEAVLDELDKLQREFKTQTVTDKIIYIEQQIEVTGTELEQLEEDLKTFREKNRRINESPALLLEQERMQRNLDIQKGIFLTLKQQLELARIEEVQKSSFVQILDYPSLPLDISNPTKLSSYILGGFAGLFLGLCLAFVIDYFSYRNPDEAEKLKTARKYLVKDLNIIKKKNKS